MFKFHRKWVLVLSILLVAPCFANTIVLTDDLLTPELYPEAAAAIRHNMQYISERTLSPAKRDVVMRSLERIERFIADDPDRHRLRIQMEQRRVNSMLTPAVATNTAGAEVVCRRIKDVGTNIWRTQCRTRAEIEEQKFASDELLGVGGSCEHCKQSDNKVRINP